SDASSVPFSDPAPTSITFTSWSCAPTSACSVSSGSGDVTTNLTLAAGASVAITVNASVPSNYNKNFITNTATVTPGTLDPNSGNNSATVTATSSAVLPT